MPFNPNESSGSKKEDSRGARLGPEMNKAKEPDSEDSSSSGSSQEGSAISITDASSLEVAYFGSGGWRSDILSKIINSQSKKQPAESLVYQAQQIEGGTRDTLLLKSQADRLYSGGGKGGGSFITVDAEKKDQTVIMPEQDGSLVVLRLDDNSNNKVILRHSEDFVTETGKQTELEVDPLDSLHFYGFGGEWYTVNSDTKKLDGMPVGQEGTDYITYADGNGDVYVKGDNNNTGSMYADEWETHTGYSKGWTGSGVTIREVGPDGKPDFIEASNLSIRGTLRVRELEVRKISFSKGPFGITPGGGKLGSVESSSHTINKTGVFSSSDLTTQKWTFENSNDDETEHGLVEGDRLLAQKFDPSSADVVGQIRAIVENVPDPHAAEVNVEDSTYGAPPTGEDTEGWEFIVAASSDTDRDSMIYMNPYGPHTDALDGLSNFDDWDNRSPVVRTGNISGANTKISSGTYGLYGESVRLTNDILIGSLDKTGNYFEYDTNGNLNVTANTFDLNTSNLRIRSEGPISNSARISLKDSNTTYDPVIVDSELTTGNLASLTNTATKTATDQTWSDVSGQVINYTEDLSGVSNYDTARSLELTGDFELSGEVDSNWSGGNGVDVNVQVEIHRQNFVEPMVAKTVWDDDTAKIQNDNTYSITESINLPMPRAEWSSFEVKFYVWLENKDQQLSWTWALRNISWDQYKSQSVLNKRGVFVKHTPNYTASVGDSRSASTTSTNDASNVAHIDENEEISGLWTFGSELKMSNKAIVGGSVSPSDRFEVYDGSGNKVMWVTDTGQVHAVNDIVAFSNGSGSTSGSNSELAIEDSGGTSLTTDAKKLTFTGGVTLGEPSTDEITVDITSGGIKVSGAEGDMIQHDGTDWVAKDVATLAGDGLESTTADNIRIDVGDGLATSSNSLEVNVSDFAGSALSADGSNNIDVDPSALDGDGLTYSGSELEVDASDLDGDGLDQDGNNNLEVDCDDFDGDGLVEDGNNNLDVVVSDFAGSGLQDDGTNDLEVSASASHLSDVSADSVSDAHHAKYTDSDAQSAISGATLSGGLTLGGNLDLQSSGDLRNINELNVSTVTSNNGSDHIDWTQPVHFNGVDGNNESYEVKISGKKLKVDTQIVCNGEIEAHASSDRRMKDNIQVVENPFEYLSRMSGRRFDWNDKAGDYKPESGFGLIAQEVQQVMPEAVRENSGGYLGLQYKQLHAIEVEAIKKMKKENDRLRQRIEKLESKINK